MPTYEYNNSSIRFVGWCFMFSFPVKERMKRRKQGTLTSIILGISIILLMPLVNNTNTVDASFVTTSFEGPEAVAFDSANGNLYVANGNADNVMVIDGTNNKVIKTIPVGLFPRGAIFDSSNGDIYVTNY